MMKGWFISAGLLASSYSVTVAATPISQLKFSDAGMEKCINDSAAIYSTTEIEKLEFVQCSVQGPISLKGLGQLPKLSVLTIIGGEIHDIDALTDAKKLEMLMLSESNVPRFDKLTHHKLNLVLNKVQADDWRQLKQLHLSSISIQNSVDCSAYKPLANDDDFILLSPDIGAEAIAQGMRTSQQYPDKLLLMMDCPVDALK
ncbi:hypothetical protein L9G15_06665 [Shewanella sp. A3A]|nr:hypothetical protein [Shewanella ferrihydritica]